MSMSLLWDCIDPQAMTGLDEKICMKYSNGDKAHFSQIAQRVRKEIDNEKKQTRDLLPNP